MHTNYKAKLSLYDIEVHNEKIIAYNSDHTDDLQSLFFIGSCSDGRRSTVTGSGTGEGSGHRKHPDLVSLCGCVPEGIPED